MTLTEAVQIKDSLEELVADHEINFGLAYELVKIRQAEALKIIRREIKELKNARTK